MGSSQRSSPGRSRLVAAALLLLGLLAPAGAALAKDSPAPAATPAPASARFRLVEIAVPPGAATLEKIAALAPGVADSVVYWGTQATSWLTGLLRR
mgnify:CR=1 FL=1